jgi:hypothetical protein
LREVRIISNNPLVTLGSDDYRISGYDVLKVLEKLRDLVHLGHRLLTHPLAGSIKPNENPFKSVVISDKASNIDVNSVLIAEDSYERAKRMLKDRPIKEYSENVLEDMKRIDLSLLEAGLQSLVNHR